MRCRLLHIAPGSESSLRSMTPSQPGCRLNLTPDTAAILLAASPPEVLYALSDLTFQPSDIPAFQKLDCSQKIEFVVETVGGSTNYIAGLRTESAKETCGTYSLNIFVGSLHRKQSSLYAVIPGQRNPTASESAAQDTKLKLLV